MLIIGRTRTRIPLTSPVDGINGLWFARIARLYPTGPISGLLPSGI
jgi:hypothetical protein